MAEVLKGDALDSGDEGYLALAEDVLEFHEWHHATTEIACTRAELTSRRSLYQTYFAHPEAAHLEEALANAQAISWAFQEGDPLRARQKVEDWMKKQGDGYRDYSSRLSPRAFSLGLDQADRFMTSVKPDPRPRTDPSFHTFLFRGARQYRSMPYTPVNDLGPIGVTVLRPFPRAHGVQIFVHSNDHPPPHIHILVLSGSKETRYSWTELVPLENDEPLVGAAKKGLSQYVDLRGTKIRPGCKQSTEKTWTDQVSILGVKDVAPGTEATPEVVIPAYASSNCLTFQSISGLPPQASARKADY